MANQVNEIILRQLSDAFAGAQGLVIVSLNGLSVEETENLRNSLAEHGVRLRMVRNRLARRALASRGFEAPAELFAGNVACAWGSTEDAVRIAKVFKGSESRKTGKVAFKGGFFEGNLLDAKAAAALAELPSKDELRAMLLGLLAGPARALVTVLAAPGASLARVVNAHAEEAHADKAPAESAPAASAEPEAPAAPPAG